MCTRSTSVSPAYHAIGKHDFFYRTAHARPLLDGHNLRYAYREGDRGPFWTDSRIYLADFARRLSH